MRLLSHSGALWVREAASRRTGPGRGRARRRWEQRAAGAAWIERAGAAQEGERGTAGRGLRSRRRRGSQLTEEREPERGGCCSSPTFPPRPRARWSGGRRPAGGEPGPAEGTPRAGRRGGGAAGSAAFPLPRRRAEQRPLPSALHARAAAVRPHCGALPSAPARTPRPGLAAALGPGRGATPLSLLLLLLLPGGEGRRPSPGG